MKYLFIFMVSFCALAKEPYLSINLKKYNLGQLKEMSTSEIVSVYNYESREFEKYRALPLIPILDQTIKDWRKNFALKFHTLDKYTPVIENYKFKERRPYLAYERADQKSFTTILGLKKNITNLGPFYLIWKEDYKRKAAKRRDHWPYKVVALNEEPNPPYEIIPDQTAGEDILWGYKNFIKQCIACHRVNNTGSKKSVELVASGVIDKFDDRKLKRFILNPRSIDKDSKMPKFPVKIDIKKKRITDIVLYLRYMRKRNFKEFNKESNIETKRNSSRYQNFLNDVRNSM